MTQISIKQLPGKMAIRTKGMSISAAGQKALKKTMAAINVLALLFILSQPFYIEKDRSYRSGRNLQGHVSFGSI
jgi:hypothetical protein